MSHARFIPIRGTEEKISYSALGYKDGCLYIATDTGNMYIDYTTSDGREIPRFKIGGSAASGGNSGIFYSNYKLTEDEKLETDISIPRNSIEGTSYPNVDDLIFNTADSSFYRVLVIDMVRNLVQARRLTVAGGSGGSGMLGKAADIDLVLDPLTVVNLINGHSQNLYFTATSALNPKGQPIDQILTIDWTLEYTEDAGETYTKYRSGKMTAQSGEKIAFEFGTLARESASSRLTLKASQANVEKTISKSCTFETSALILRYKSGFSNIGVVSNSNVNISCNVYGDMDKKLEWYFDNEEEPIYSQTILYNPESNEHNGDRNLNVNTYVKDITPGAHKVWIKMYQLINGEKGDMAEPLYFELGVKDGNPEGKPIIWLGDYKQEYFTYETIQIPFRVYDPKNLDKVTVYYKKNGIELDNSPQIIDDMSKYAIFEISNAEKDIINQYTISCERDGKEVASRKIEVIVKEDPQRTNFKIWKQESLIYELDTVGSGRSNNQSKDKRETLINRGIAAKFENFNWYNNGWIRDKEGKTCLRISNGARLSIPLGPMTFSKPQGGSDSHTIEIQFKVNNVQDYSNLITNITRYVNDDQLYEKFYNEAEKRYETQYTNYDSFLTWYLKTPNHGFEVPVDKENPEAGMRPMTYDDLEFASIQKRVNLSNIVCGYYTGSSDNVIGLCLGPQDAFFSNGKDKVSVAYVEDKIITLSAVFQYADKEHETQRLISLYLNGILTGVIKSSLDDPFVINTENIIFDSKNCDIDLYKLRVYNEALNVNDIVMNYAYDFKNVDIYDQNQLAQYQEDIDEYRIMRTEMIKYNNNHPQSPLMPYIIFDTSKLDEDKLSYAKTVNQRIGVEFVNTPLELAYTNGELERLAKEDGLWDENSTPEEKQEAVKKYYKHHCPSWVGENVNMAVQGTSSEFYPRRNYKLKTKTIDEVDQFGEKYPQGEEKERVHIFLNRGPFADDYEKDMTGIKLKKYIKSTSGKMVDGIKYYEDENGEKEVIFSQETGISYQPDTYYIKNNAWVEYGKEKTRQKYFYFNNYTAGTTKFTMKIDFMESSGSYNMGFANLVHNAYSKHPVSDLNASDALVETDSDSSSYVPATDYIEGTTYYYLTHKGVWKTADGNGESYFKITSVEDFAKTPAELFREQAPEGTKLKILTTDKYDFSEGKNEIEVDEIPDYVNKWFVATIGYKKVTVSKTEDYRTSVQGFRTMAFQKRKDGSYQYIGMYNMLLDKGSDEAFGFKLDKTTGKTILANYADKKPMKEVTECWEFENNNRTFCSFRDPLNRKDLSFDVYTMSGDKKEVKLNSVKSAPLVADSFEYRYHNDGDILDYVCSPIKEADKINAEDTQDYMSANNIDFTFNKDDPTINQEARYNFVLDRYKNWEKAVAWVWSTNTDNVISQGGYIKVKVGLSEYIADTYFIDDYHGGYTLDTAGVFNPEIKYFNKQIIENRNEDGTLIDTIITYVPAYVGTKLYTNANETYYKISSDTDLSAPEDTWTYVICDNKTVIHDEKTNKDIYSEPFDSNIDYYQLPEDNETINAQLAEKEANGKVDRLVQLSPDVEFNSEKIYYNYDGTQQCGHATSIANVTADTWEANKYYEGIEIAYGNKKHLYDTKEYRTDKFINELTKHFDLEYMATYFIMTEVFECYDSRGKNCMMATWGPQERKGDYIWYPIFYDIDTQLGINNTGIPSFEYNVDATIDGNYSTSDSVLWNNFYKYFKTSAILMKYRQLRGATTGISWGSVKPILKQVDTIEKWYNTDPEECKSIAMRGVRPLVAINLDEYYKYITITNPASYQNGVTGHLSMNSEGKYTFDKVGGFFYALQGDRSLSRRQFLTNRIEYIDSWLNEGNYQRGGDNLIRGRVAANNALKTSDEWVETASQPYWKDEATNLKSHKFDAEYWVTLTPTHSSYVTLGDDAEAYPSRKYDGIHPLRFEIEAIENGVRKSNNYPEQLLYIYGINQMKDLGDMSNLYWQEFVISGDAKKLTNLRLGSDYKYYDEEEGKWIEWHNHNVNLPVIPAAKTKDNEGMPLLKEINLCNMNINVGSPVLNLTSCEKLENFRATGSNYNGISFADGVALHTCYLPQTITELKLVEARLLKNVLKPEDYHSPILNEDGTLSVRPGLYIEELYDTAPACNITKLTIAGGGLGYDSYDLLKQYYNVRKDLIDTVSNVSMTDVVWSPYIQVSADETYDSNSTYYVDNGHYCFNNEPYVYQKDGESDGKALARWINNITNGEIYKYVPGSHYVLVDKFDIYNNEVNYYTTANENDSIDINPINYVYINEETWNADVAQNKIYTYKENLPYEQITDLSLLTALAENEDFIKNDTNNIPEITGIVYINNTEPVDEYIIRNEIQPLYPELKFFFANVNKSYTAKFVLMNEDEGEDGLYRLIGSQTVRDTTEHFKNPIDQYGDISKFKPNHDFYGWAKSNSLDAEIIVNIDKTINDWLNEQIQEDQYDYIYYAICPIHSWDVKFYDGDKLIGKVEKVPHGNVILSPSVAPHRDDSDLDLRETYQLLGYSRSATATTPMNLAEFAIVEDTTFYAIWNPEPISVYDNIQPGYFSVARTYSWTDDGEFNINEGVELQLDVEVTGKLTVPAMFNGKPVISITPSFGAPTTTDGTKQRILTNYINNENVVIYDGPGNGGKLTHIFFQQINNKANIRMIPAHTFEATTNLIYCEYPYGLRVIDDYAFYCNYVAQYMNDREKLKSKLISATFDGTIKQIGNNAFRRSFASTVNEIVLGPQVETVGELAFSSNADLSGYFHDDNITTITIGNETEGSRLTSVSTTPSFSYPEATVYFYTSNPAWSIKLSEGGGEVDNQLVMKYFNQTNSDKIFTPRVTTV